MRLFARAAGRSHLAQLAVQAGKGSPGQAPAAVLQGGQRQAALIRQSGGNLFKVGVLSKRGSQCPHGGGRVFPAHGQAP